MNLFKKLFSRSEPVPPDPIACALFDLEWVPGASVEAHVQTLRNAAPSTGRWPLVLGDEQSTRRLIGELAMLSPQERNDINPVDPFAWLEARAASDPDGYSCEAGNWVQAEPTHDLASVRDPLTHELLPWIGVAMVNASDPSEFLTIAQFGGWNECPPLDVHFALAQLWRARYGAVLAAVSMDSLEYIVTSPPATREEALELARLLYLYCPDLVDQGTKELAPLAAGLVGSTVWSFWWD